MTDHANRRFIKSPRPDGRGWYIRRVDTLQPVAYARRKADATLFALAPDLYEVLTDAVDDGQHAARCPPGPCYCWRADAVAVLRKIAESGQ